MKLALPLLVLAGCGGDSRKLEATCGIDRSGAAKPTEVMLERKWSLHDRENPPRLRGATVRCTIQGRKGVVVTSEKPAAKGRTSEETGTLVLEFPYDKLDRALTELVFRGDDLTARVPVPDEPRLTITATTDAGVATISGTVSGTDKLTVAGEPVTVTGGTFEHRIEVWPWLVERLAADDLPLGPVRSLTLLAIAGEGAKVDYEFVTTPAPTEIAAYTAALLTEGTPFPGAPAAEVGKPDRPTLVVMHSETGQRLIASQPGLRVTAVELIAHVALVNETLEICRYHELETPEYDNFPATRKLHRYAVTVTEAKTGQPVTKGDVRGTPPPPCPEFMDVPKGLDERTFHGEMPTYEGLRAWLREVEVKASRPKGR